MQAYEREADGRNVKGEESKQHATEKTLAQHGRSAKDVQKMRGRT